MANEKFNRMAKLMLVLHAPKPGRDGGETCSECGCYEYPCRTVRIVNALVEERSDGD